MIKKILVCLLATLTITGCVPSDEVSETKTEYYLNELATIDQYQIELTAYEYKNERLVLTFEIMNDFDHAQIIDKNNFALINGSEQILPNNNLNQTISTGDTKEVKINFDITELEEYTIVFYSKVVTNNIGFKIEL